ncbi:hypothetical protein [Streptantibioticus cattleyicolor]|uniref:Uncharacterized protein n=1 Tax=Streptantibioticus cattleyicolor (strain ATCC 35852 / DSM 46488 / JCM 4925 / NBRC 14057 / NRRL 8057) TaxID=1003195 RepID=F8JL24_STREN|nr:hypothetical protein [Streptantibioticus cattleyicolor]AEW98396.1 hypothetical protein SCATT_p02030 [Streptantibioticus cattleyicolor NRRL 8057 = DSM 46488]CCB72544.1 protein of unknown function [Streptantibioticus cattleyicolor NRRL 8057 = DSM 46488]
MAATASTAPAATAGASAGSDADWPSDQQVFLLVGRDLLARLLQGALDQWRGTSLAKDDKGNALGRVWWEATFQGASNVTVDADDPTSVSADFDIPWAVGLDLFSPGPGKGCALFKASQES